MDADRATDCITTLEHWGYTVRVGKTLGRSFHYFSGTDEERLDDLQDMLDDPDLRAIRCGQEDMAIVAASSTAWISAHFRGLRNGSSVLAISRFSTPIS